MASGYDGRSVIERLESGTISINTISVIIPATVQIGGIPTVNVGVIPTLQTTNTTLASVLSRVATNTTLTSVLGRVATQTTQTLVLSRVATNTTLTALSTLLGVGLRPYDRSLFGGFRSHHDVAIFERLHDYPGTTTTAYDIDSYGFEADGGGVGSISHVANQGALRLSVNAGTAGGKARLRTHDIMRYQPGCSPVVQITGYASAAMDALRAKRRTYVSGAAVDVHLATINGYNADKANRYEIRYAYLGVEGAEFYVNGDLVYTFDAAGTLSEPYMRTANLPLSVEVINSSATSQVVQMGVLDDKDGLFFEWKESTPAAFDFTYKCASVRLIGGNGYPHKSFTFSRATTGVGATLIPLFSMRLPATLNGVENKVQVFPATLVFYSESQPGALELVWNPQTLTGAAFTTTSPSRAVEIDRSASALTVGTGISVFRTGQGANGYYTYDLKDIFHLLDRKLRRQAYTGTSDVLTVAVQRETNQNFDPRATLTWMELR